MRITVAPPFVDRRWAPDPGYVESFRLAGIGAQHFVQRLARSRAHKQMKGAEVPFEDENFAYVALTRGPGGQRPSRVLAQPEIGKVEVSAKLCTPDGLETTHVPRRDKAAYASARRWRWGDTVPLN